MLFFCCCRFRSSSHISLIGCLVPCAFFLYIASSPRLPFFVFVFPLLPGVRLPVISTRIPARCRLACTRLYVLAALNPHWLVIRSSGSIYLGYYCQNYHDKNTAIGNWNIVIDTGMCRAINSSSGPWASAKSDILYVISYFIVPVSAAWSCGCRTGLPQLRPLHVTGGCCPPIC